ncbi:hypothetical protein Zm00014a_010446 [Zea mays]|uniref:Uncharacterized protein n=1 Tax=Zea mays TaxID=4577 RepID=A0A3L6F070_MAIZE|nr:hypothetical protein Zm00014a_010446 [Zea mays]
MDDAARVRRVESRLRHVLRGGALGARMVRADAAAINMDQRLHQLLNEDGEAESRANQATAVAVQDFGERGYSVLTRRYPHLFLDDEEAAAIIPPTTRPTTPKAPVMIAMPIIPSAFNHQAIKFRGALVDSTGLRPETKTKPCFSIRISNYISVLYNGVLSP